jgi:AraC family transcriptional regulator
LSRAAPALASGHEKVIDVALRYGYDTPEAFAKAFKRLFGMPPSGAMRPGARLIIFPPLTVAVVLKGGQSMQFSICTQEQPIVVSGLGIRVCKSHQQQLKDIPLFWRQLVDSGSIRSFRQHCGPLGLLGVCCEWDANTEEFSYLIAIEQPEVSQSGINDQRNLILPAGQYAVFELEGALPHVMQDAWQRIYTEWFPNSGYEHAGGPDFERYPPFAAADPRADPASPQCVTEIWIPIKKMQ